MHLSFGCFQGPRPPSSFHDLDYTFSGFLPFKFYPFMCELQPFYFDEQQPKLHHWVKELYRFRAYAMDFSIERNQGLPSILFHLGLKQSLKTTDFFLIPKDHSFRRISFSKEYAYLLSASWFSQGAYLSNTSQDWFYTAIEPRKLSLFLLESLFRKHQRRFWRLRLKGFWNRHLRLETLFSMSSLHTGGSLDSDLPYQGPDSSSYHFSFLSNSLDHRSLALSPVRLFNFKYKRLLSCSLYNFSLKVNFRRPLAPPSLAFLSSLNAYISLYLGSALYFLFYYSLLFWKPLSFPLVSPLYPEALRPWALSFSSSLNFYHRTKYYFLPKAFLFCLRPGSYRRSRIFLSFYHNLISLYKPHAASHGRPSLRSLWKKVPKIPWRVQRSLFALRRAWYRKRRDNRGLLARLHMIRLLKLRAIYRLRRKFLLLFFSALQRPGVGLFSSSKLRLLFFRKLRFVWNRFPTRRRFFRLRWQLFLKKRRWKVRKLRRLRLFFLWKRFLERSRQRNKSLVLLDVKFLLRKLFVIFLALQKGSFWLGAGGSFSSSLRILRKYLQLQRSFWRYLRHPILALKGQAVSQLRALELYRSHILSCWARRWKHFAQRFVLLRRIALLGAPLSALRPHYISSFKRMLRLKQKLATALLRLSKVAETLRRRAFYSYSLPSSQRRRFSFKKRFLLRKALLPTVSLFKIRRKLKFLTHRRSAKRRFWLRSKIRRLSHRARSVKAALARSKVHLKRLSLRRRGKPLWKKKLLKVPQPHVSSSS